MWIILLFYVLFMPVTSYGVTEIDSAAIFIEKARKQKLSEKTAWLNLLHYKSTFLGGYESQVDGRDFFLAENGAYDAQAELEADIRGFFSYKTSAHPRCLFPARFHWLDARLNFSHLLPEMECGKLKNWQEKIKGSQITLLFPSMYLENPASMFGHTFIRFDRPDNNHLLSQTLSYAASHVESDNLLVYSWKGITGGYQGRFFLQAYYETLQEYSDIEQRDIWEYKLNLNKEEIDQLIRHLWEVRGIHFDYFFFRENCSYRLLALLDVARENINMSIDAHPIYAAPVDTVRDIEQAGLISESHYRPAVHNKISQMSEQVDQSVRDDAFALAKNEITISDISHKYSEDQQVQVYQLADVVLDQFKEPSAEQQSLQFDILSSRSHLSIKKHKFNFDTIPPESSHLSARLQLSAGEYDVGNKETEPFYEIGIRPVFHDLLDKSDGFVNGASISILEAQFRWYQRQEKLKLEKLNLFSLQSIVAVSPWATPISKKISFQVKQRNLTVDSEITEFEFKFAMGYSAEVKSVLMYALAQTQFEYATELENNHALYLGFNTGLLWEFDNSVFSGQTEIEYQLSGDVSGEEGGIQKLNVGAQFNVVDDHALRFEYEMTDYEKFEVKELKLSYLIYF
ncbi:MAG: hypothetical protein DIZ80_14350 [endosymbiont of Galathealinum brachiosum]|uniref:Uncharacterized protein n=1 Tax=endosymbiont of Galathealinum brachiosum TaxID=2200906 RepID=A0A370D8Q1_9GAMM|nr:MAG: hypothetical protein DIZ80_14350 [endosymbiont of Galathealinum brachiosum]